MTRLSGIAVIVLLPLLASAQGGDQQVRVKADQLFQEQRYAEAMPLYSQLVSLTPGDRNLNYRFGACLLFGNADKEPAIGHLRFATDAPNTDPMAWYWLGRAYHLNYRFKEAQVAYQRFLGTADKKLLAQWPVEALQRQSRNGEKLLSSLKEITVRSKVEVADADFFRFYDLTDIGGRIVVLPEELKTSLDKKKKERFVAYLPERKGTIYFSSYGKDGATGKDIYRTELLPDGTFAAPVKLAGYINTEQDEDFPFMHPDGKTFFFCSKGHNSMGGYDVFRTSYDAGLDAFGRPENLDFAVSTPDDDILYIVDAEQKEACFASGRNSKQGNLHVYRVGTAQAPVLITVFKGTYASSIDQEDRKARIIVEDVLSQEMVADVRTDINGNYVLSVPRAGRYRYRVECGPTGKTHGGIVEVPKADGPRAYRQELILDRKGDLEQLTIRNYFDEPLSDDLVALALDEIKRRARLDVSSREVVAERPAPKEEPAGDIMTRAGFTGDIDQPKAIQLAKDDARELEAQSMELQAQAAEAFALAMDAANEAEKATAKSADLVRSATESSADQDRINTLMTEAARERQRAREATLRAKAAFNAGTSLSTAALAGRQRSLAASKLSSDLANATVAKNDEAALQHLRTLKQRLDEKSRPDPGQEPVEQARRQLADQEKESTRLLNAAKRKRDEENEVADRITRVKRELEGTRARSKQDELARQITELEEQYRFMRQETQAAVNRAAAAERQTAALRGQASLTRHLAETTDRGAGTELTMEQAERLGLRITSTDQRAADLAIDDRFDALAAAERAQAEQRVFDWDLVSAAQAVGEQRETTRPMERDAQGNERVDMRSGNIRQGTDESKELRAGNQPANGTVPEQPRSSEPGRTAANANEPKATVAAAETKSQSRTDAHENDIVSAQRAAGVPVQAPPHAVEDRRFILDNQRAELVQLAATERNRTRKDSLNRLIAAIEADLAIPDSKLESQQEEEVVEADMSRPVMVFTSAATDEEIIAKVYSGHAADLERAKRMSDADARADAINGIELMLADSIRAEMQRQVAVLQLSPQQADVVLPRVDRLRRLREDRLARGEQAIQERQAELNAAQPLAVNAAKSGVPRAAGTHDPINDRFVAIDRYASNVYASKLEHRSRGKGIDEAIAFRDADVSRIDGLTVRIDSMEKQLAGMPFNKESDRLRKKTDQLIDERYIIRTDLGQRSAYITKEEWRTASDSLKRIDAKVAARGLAPDEPLVQMAKEMEAEGKYQFDGAAQLRKRADRMDDIVARDSLYRRAYRNELEALRLMDRAITVRNHLASDAHQRGERLSYEEVASKVLGISLEEPLLAQEPPASPGRGTDDSAVPALSGAESRNPARTVEERQAQGTSETDQAIGKPGGSEDSNAAAARTGGANESTNETQGETGSAARAAEAGAATSVNAPQDAKAIEAIIAQAEQRLTSKDLVPAKLYERFLSSEQTTLTPMMDDPGSDPDLLAIRAESAQRASQDLERRSQEAADRAAALSDSAAAARKRDREVLEALSVKERRLSDSLHTAALGQAEQARVEERRRADADAMKAQRDRLLKFYYLSPEDQEMVMLDGDASRYFQARARALEQQGAAVDATDAAKSHRDVAVMLRQQARESEKAATDGRMPATDATQRTLVLDSRARTLEQKADSLESIAARLRGAAGINEAQAGVMLQALPAIKSSELMALEQRARRNDALAMEQRNGGAGAQPSVRLDRPASQSPAERTEAQAAAAPMEPIALQKPSQTAGQSQMPGSAGIAQVATTEQPVAPAQAAADPLAAANRPVESGAFRMPDELVEDVFAMTAPGIKREQPIAMDGALPSGIVFKVQIGAFRKPVPQEAFSDMTPVMGETVGNGLVRYTAGLFTSADGALAAKDLVRQRGYGDAFVVAYRDGERVPLGVAMRESRARTQAATAQRQQGEEPVQRVPEPRVTQQPAAPVAIERPVPPSQTAAEGSAAILERYPDNAEQIIAAFVPSAEATAYYNVPGAAPAKQVETIKGLFFTVQVGVYSKPVALDKLFNITPLNSELTETAKVRYTTGRYRDMDAVRARKDEAVGLGVKDAFITAYLNGKRIPVREATALLERFGPEILAQP